LMPSWPACAGPCMHRHVNISCNFHLNLSCLHMPHLLRRCRPLGGLIACAGGRRWQRPKAGCVRKDTCGRHEVSGSGRTADGLVQHPRACRAATTFGALRQHGRADVRHASQPPCAIVSGAERSGRKASLLIRGTSCHDEHRGQFETCLKHSAAVCHTRWPQSNVLITLVFAKQQPPASRGAAPQTTTKRC
jgi:hypothetical protein